MKPISYIQLIRPVQWLKNLILLFPPFLGGQIFKPGILAAALLPFTVFCLASSATYIINDVSDSGRDLEHPVKRLRPLPSGAVTVVSALLLASVFLLAALCLALTISIKFFLLLLTYLIVTLSYSFVLKDYPVVDLFCISAGFILRLQAGGVAFQIPISEWLFLSVFLLSIFLSTGKRYSEKRTLGDRAGAHRTSLSSYPDGFLDGTMFMTGSAVLVTYTMYVVNRHTDILLYTVPLCCFGLLRYLFRVQSGQGGDPTESLTRDVLLFIVGLAWVVMVGWGVYGR